MGEDRRMGDRRSGIADRRLDSSSEQYKMNFNNDSNYVSLPIFIAPIATLLIIMCIVLYFVYSNLNKKIENISNHVDSSIYTDDNDIEYTDDDSSENTSDTTDEDLTTETDSNDIDTDNTDSNNTDINSNL